MEKGSPDFSLYGRPDIVFLGVNITLGGFADYSEMAAEIRRLARVYPDVISEKIAACAEKIAEEES